MSTTELHTVLKMENRSSKSSAKCSHQGCELKEEIQHIHANILYDQIVDGAAADPEKVKLDVIFGFLRQLEKFFDEKQKQNQNK